MGKMQGFVIHILVFTGLYREKVAGIRSRRLSQIKIYLISASLGLKMRPAFLKYVKLIFLTDRLSFTFITSYTPLLKKRKW
jgi:hypothetical protein